VTAETSAPWVAAPRSGYALAVVGEIVIAVALLVSAGILAESGATDHSRLHAAIGLALLAIAGIILRVPQCQSREAGPSRWPALLAAAQLIESVAGWRGSSPSGSGQAL
jgi:hypothetical protein